MFSKVQAVAVAFVLIVLTTVPVSAASGPGALFPLGQQPVPSLRTGAPQPPAEDPIPKLMFGLSVTASDDGKVSGSYSAGTETIYFEILRGERNDSPDADAPQFGRDIRVMDRDRTPFVLQTAGGAPASHTWFADTLKAESMPIDVEARQRSFALFPRAARALRAYVNEYPASLDDVSPLIELLEYYTVEELQDIEGVPQPAIGTEAVTQAKYTHKVTIRKKRSSFNLPKREYEHSAVILEIYKQGGALLTSWYSSNHGTAATSSLMTTKCSKSITKTDVSFNMWDIMCESYRSVWPVTHLCNDDTRQQYLSIKNSSTKDWGVCKGFRLYAPECD